MSKLIAWLFKQRSVGCGPSFLPQWLIDFFFGWFFEADCEKHDEGYQKGGDWVRKLECDFKFYLAMLRDSQRSRGFKKALKLLVATIYFWIVLLLGWLRFNYKGGNYGLQ